MADLIPSLPKSIATVSLSGMLGKKMEARGQSASAGLRFSRTTLLTFQGSPTDKHFLAESLGVTIARFQPSTSRLSRFGKFPTSVRMAARAERRGAAPWSELLA
jgi:hypothetical protein